MTTDVRDADKTMPYEIGDRAIGGVLDQSIYLFRDHFSFIMKTIGVILLPSYFCMGLLYIIFAPNAIDVWSDTEPSSTEFIASAIVSVVATLLLGLFIVPLTQAALIFGIASRYLGKAPTVRECFSYGLRRLGWLVVGNILVGMAVGVGMLFCLVPGFVVMALFYIFPTIVVLERSNTFDALSRSTRLMRGYIWSIIALIIILSIIQAAIGSFSALAPANVLYQGAAYLMQAISLAFLTIVGVVMYFVARSRVEHLDLELMANAVDAAPETGSTL